MPAQTRLKFRKPGDAERRSLQELKADLEVREKKTAASRGAEPEDADEDVQSDAKRRRLLEQASTLDADDSDGDADATGGDAPCVPRLRAC